MKRNTIIKTIIFLVGIAILSFIGSKIFPILGMLSKFSILGVIVLLGYLLYKKLFNK